MGLKSSPSIDASGMISRQQRFCTSYPPARRTAQHSTAMAQPLPAFANPHPAGVIQELFKRNQAFAEGFDRPLSLGANKRVTGRQGLGGQLSSQCCPLTTAMHLPSQPHAALC